MSEGERSHILCDFLLNYLFRVRISEGNMDIKICGERKANPGKSCAQARWLRFADPGHFSKCLMIKLAEVEHTVQMQILRRIPNTIQIYLLASLNEFSSRIHDGRSHKILIKCSRATDGRELGVVSGELGFADAINTWRTQFLD